jgi:hypothetical protein
VAQWIPTRDGKTRCVRHSIDFALPDTCTKCISDPGEPDPEGEENESPYLEGLRTNVEWERECAEIMTEIRDRARKEKRATGAAALYGQVFKFIREARTACSERERAYLVRKYQRELEATRKVNEAVVALAPKGKHVKPNGPEREGGN